MTYRNERTAVDALPRIVIVTVWSVVTLQVARWVSHDEMIDALATAGLICGDLALVLTFVAQRDRARERASNLTTLMTVGLWLSAFALLLECVRLYIRSWGSL